jgi:Mor family transcriptional regulator
MRMKALDFNQIRAEYEAGGTSATLAQKLKVSLATAVSLMRMLDDAAWIHAEYKSGATTSKLAHKYNLDENKIRDLIRRAGGVIHGRGYKKLSVDDAQLRAEYVAGATAEDLARSYGVTAATILSAIRRAGGTPTHRQRTFSPAEKKAIVEEYETTGLAHLSVKHRTGVDKIREIIKEKGGVIQPIGRPLGRQKRSRFPQIKISSDYAAGLSLRTLAAKYGCSHETIRTAIIQTGGMLRASKT